MDNKSFFKEVYGYTEDDVVILVHPSGDTIIAGRVILLPSDILPVVSIATVGGKKVTGDPSHFRLCPEGLAISKAVQQISSWVEREWSSYEEEKEKFAEEVKANPSYAIEWGREIVYRTARAKIANSLIRSIEHALKEPENWNYSKLEELYNDWAEREIKHPLLSNYHRANSTSPFSNAVAEVNRTALSMLYTFNIKYLRDMLEIVKEEFSVKSEK